MNSLRLSSLCSFVTDLACCAAPRGSGVKKPNRGAHTAVASHTAKLALQRSDANDTVTLHRSNNWRTAL
jgi:hypothetical protein